MIFCDIFYQEHTGVHSMGWNGLIFSKELPRAILLFLSVFEEHNYHMSGQLLGKCNLHILLQLPLFFHFSSAALGYRKFDAHCCLL